jgi:hypothetical protein
MGFSRLSTLRPVGMDFSINPFRCILWIFSGWLEVQGRQFGDLSRQRFPAYVVSRS